LPRAARAPSLLAMESARRPWPLHTRILLGLGLGAGLGVACNLVASGHPQRERLVAIAADGIAHPVGQLFLRLLFLVVVPLVFCSLSVGVANLGNLGKLGRLGGRALLFFLLTTAFSVALGLFLMNTLRPGEGFDPDVRAKLVTTFGADTARIQGTAAASGADSLLGVVNQVLDAFLPRNVLRAAVDMQMLPIIVFALLLGIALGGFPAEKRRAFTAWLETLGDAMVAIVQLAMRLAPYAVACLMFSVTAKFGYDLLAKLATYVLIVISAYLVQLFLLYPLLARVLAGRAPLDFFRRAVPIIATAFSTSSSNATIPTSLRVVQSDFGVRPSVAGFVIPLGATMNMNGTALFEGAVVLFLAQIFGVPLDLGEQALVVLLCVFSAIGAAGIPGGSLPLLMIVMGQVGVPPEGIAIIVGVDRLLDMGRTVTNVMGDVTCALYIEEVERRAERA
jgi:DAACS family dicarboxylate/amino acid:cation (Na+ or H+) symporter